MTSRYKALEAVRKKLLGKKLDYQEIYAIMDDIAHQRMGDVLTAYFAAAGFSKGFTNQEVYYLTKAMVETGDQLHFKGTVADKHSIGGMPGSRKSLIIVPIVAAAGFRIPKTSSRAITTPAGTADCMEVLAPVDFSAQQLQKIVQKVGGCIAWTGSFNIAPADEEIIEIEKPLLMESYDKILVSVMAKKVACGSTHLVIDIPYGQTMKIKRKKDAKIITKKFIYLAKKFSIKIRTLIMKTKQPAGQGIGPLLETKDALKVLLQTEDRSFDLEERSLELASALIALCSQERKKKVSSRKLAEEILISGKAMNKMRAIIKAQGGNPHVQLRDLNPAKHTKKVKAKKSGAIKAVNNKNLSLIARLLGAPDDKKAGLYLEKRLGDRVKKGEILYNLYSSDKIKLKEAVGALPSYQIYKI